MVSSSDFCCFPSDGKVITRQGQVSIGDIRPGDEVLAMSGRGELLFSEVWVVTHHDPRASMAVVALTTESGARLRLSPGHYLPSLGEDGAAAFVLARHVTVGTRLLTGLQAGEMAREDRVVAVEEEEGAARGKHALLTLEGSQVVDGVVASCYEESAHPTLAQPGLAPLRLAYRWLPRLAGAALNFPCSSSSSSLGVPAWALLARRYLAPLLPSLT